MANFTSKGLRTCLIALAAVALFGCDDGEGTETDTGTTGSDTSTSTEADGTSTATGDMTSTENDGTMTTGTDTTLPDTTINPGDPLDITWPATPEDYIASTSLVSYVSTLQLPPTQDGVATCCRDFGAISKDFIQSEGASNQLDNALGALVDGLGSIAGDSFDVNALIAEQIADGTVVILWDHVEHSGTPTDADDFVLVGLLGEFDTDTTYAEASAGTGNFLVSPNSFVTGGDPLIDFNPSSMTDGSMVGGPSTFVLSLPLFGADLSLSISEALVAGDASLDPAVGYSNGTLSGYINVEEVVTAVNTFLDSDACSCLGLTGSVYSYDTATGDIGTMCLTPAEVTAACPADEEEVCRVLAGGEIMGIQACTLLPGLIGNTADIDTNGDCAVDPDNCAYEAISVGLTWTGSPANITGIATVAP